MTFSTFISYRRNDSGPFVDSLQLELRSKLPKIEVFRDIEGIAAAEDYAQVLQKKIDAADLFLAVIGPSWAGARGGRRRIDDRDDVVRREVAWRLRPRDSQQLILGGPGGSRSVTGPEPEPPPLLPVLVGGADMPDQRSLPQDIRKLARQNAVRIPGNAERGYDFSPLVNELRNRLQQQEARDSEITSTLEDLENELAQEPATTGGPSTDYTPQVGVTLSHFSHLGSWTCNVEPEAPDAPGKYAVEFVVRSDNSMSGQIITRSRGLFGGRSRKEPIEGRAELRFFRPDGSNQLYPMIRLEGVRGGAQRFLLEIPIQRQLGRLFVGSGSGQSFALKQTGEYGL